MDTSPLTVAPPLRVLVVDDEPLSCWSIAETLSERGNIVTQAEDGEAAVSAIVNAFEPMDVVLLDYRLPDSRDLRLLAKVRGLIPRCPVILMTAHGTPEITREALALGAYCVVPKPFEMQDVADLVQQAHDSGAGSAPPS